MGRYYSGDIEGKFWFGVQSSDAADRFGKTGQTPAYLEYFYEIDDLPIVMEEIASIEATLGEKKAKMDEFFENKISYRKEQLFAECGITEGDLSEYADLLLGYQILEALRENGKCEFTAEIWL